MLMAPHSGLRGRRGERHALDRVVDQVQAGHSRVLVLRGEAGIGKSALLDYVAGRAAECRVMRAAGVESEMELAFAGLHQLCVPMLDHLDRLPGPQREALSTIFGLSAGPAPDRFLIGLAVLSLFAEVAEERPLICLVDDAQWLDRASAQTLAFVARRMLAEPVGLIFAERSEHGDPGDRGKRSEPAFGADQPELVVGGLADNDARAVLTTALPGPIDSAVRDRIVAESRGNPLALVELPHTWSAGELAGGFGLPETTQLANRIEQSYLSRLRELSALTQQAVLTAAAEPVGDVTLLWRALQRQGIAAAAASAAEAAGLIELGTQVRFRHPLVRSAVYGAASPDDRRQAHRALAEVTDPQLDPDRRAWHLAHATAGLDEQVAPSWNGPRAARGRAAGWPRRPPSWTGPPG